MLIMKKEVKYNIGRLVGRVRTLPLNSIFKLRFERVIAF
jgi:hypothetical protein